jgi:hypothetical protein
VLSQSQLKRLPPRKRQRLRQAGKMKHQQMKRLQTPNCEVAT